MKKQPEWHEGFDWVNSTQEERDKYYRTQVVMCEGNMDNKMDRCGWIKQKFEHFDCAGSSWLDLASHDGFVTRSFLRHGCSVLGVDISEDAIEVAKRNAQAQCPGTKWKYICQNFFELEWDEIMVDYTCCFEFIEHIPRDAVSLLLRLIDDSTEHAVFLSTPHINGRYGKSDPNGSHINLYTPEVLEKQILDITGCNPRVEGDDTFIYAYYFPKGSKHYGGR